MDYSLIEVYTQETAHHGGAPVYSVIMDRIRSRRLAARVHVYRGIAGAYEGGEFSTVNLVDLSANLPIKVEIVLPAAQVEGLLAILQEIVHDGVVAVRPLDVRHHRSAERLIPRDLRVVDVMTPNPVRAQPDTPVREVVSLLMAHRFKGVPVVDREDRVLGIVTEDDLIWRGGLPVRPGLLARLGATGPQLEADLAHLAAQSVEKVMTAPALTVSALAYLDDAVAQMARHSFRTMPVVDGSGRLVGMLSRLDILRSAVRWTRSLEDWKAGQLHLTGQSRVRDAISGADRTISPQATLLEAGEAMLRTGGRRLAAVGPDQRVVGIIAESDLLQALAPERAGLWDFLVRRLSRAQMGKRHPGLFRRVQAKTVAEAMVRQPVIARADEALSAALGRMMDHGLRELPVMDAEGRFQGFLSRSEVLRAIAGLPANSRSEE